jgi:hypothetical protein
MIDSIKKFSSSLSHNLLQMEDQSNLRQGLPRMKSFNLTFEKNKKEMEKIYVVLMLETFIVLYKFKDLHSKFVSSELLKIVVKCAQKISDLTNKITEDQGDNRIGYNFTD